MSYTTYNLYENNTSRTEKSRLATTRNSDFFEAPTKLLGVIYNIHADNYYVLSILGIFMRIHSLLSGKRLLTRSFNLKPAQIIYGSYLH